MKCKNGPTVTYELVYCFLPKTIMTLGSDGFYREDGMAIGHMVKSTSMGRVMYHRVEELMKFKCGGDQ